jgi:hypothetical protein
MSKHAKKGSRSVNRRAVLTAGTGAAASLAGCQMGDGDPGTTTDTTRAMPDTTDTGAIGHGASGTTVVMSTDGSTVTATGPDGVIDEGGDAGAVLQSVVAQFTQREPAGGHVHFGAGVFPWSSEVESSVGFRITGEWYATRLNAESEIPAFIKFSAAPDNIQHGPKIEYLNVQGNDQAENFLWFDACDGVYVAHCSCRATTQSMIYVLPTGGQERYDNAHYLDLRAYDTALAYHDVGTTWAADCKIEACAVNRPKSYGLILKNAERHEIVRFYSGWGTGSADGVVLLELQNAENRSGKCIENHLHMIEMEDFTGGNPTAITIRSAEDAIGVNQNHVIDFPRTHQSSGQQILSVQGSETVPVRNVRLEGLQRTVEHEEAIELRNTMDCSLNYDYHGRTPPEGVVESNAIRTRYNGVGYNQGDPRNSGEWSETGMVQPKWSSELPPANAGGNGQLVLDQTTGDLYIYAGDGWQQLAAN